MSYKTGVFNAGLFPSPQTKCNFMVLVPALTAATVLVAATTYPSIGVGSVAVPFRGENIYRPTVPEQSGTWICRAPESQIGVVKEFFHLGMTKLDMNNMEMTKLGWAVIVPLALGLVPMPWLKLGDCWLKSKSSVDLDYSSVEPLVWELEFHYSYIVESHMIYKQNFYTKESYNGK